MSGRKNVFVTTFLVLSVSLTASALSAMLVSYHDSRLQCNLLNAVYAEILERAPETRNILAIPLKECTSGNLSLQEGNEVLSAWGYQLSDFSNLTYRQNVFWIMAGFLFGAILFLFTFCIRNKIESARIKTLTDYLEQVNTGKAVILSTSGEDDFARLEDEIYKTVTYLYQTKDAAVQAKDNFAENLANIAHQIKTPITAISLSLQMMSHSLARQSFYLDCETIEQVEKQLARLTHLEEALLILSRIDAGTLLLQKKEVDVYTLLVLSAETLQELFTDSHTSIQVPELGEMMICADMDWTMEAVMNLMKNCMEHSPGKEIHCSYAQNLLYTEILLWDEGEGFAKEDLSHLFERFYRGQHAKEGGIGIGLALAKEIFERQNASVHAKNRQGGGAEFSIRFYRH